MPVRSMDGPSRQPHTEEPVEEESFSYDSELEGIKNGEMCDRCGFQAYYKAMRGDSQLLFCGHHGRHHFTALISQKFAVQDETFKLALR